MVLLLYGDDMFSGVGAFLWDGVSGHQDGTVSGAHGFTVPELSFIVCGPTPACWVFGEASLADALTERHWFPHS